MKNKIAAIFIFVAALPILVGCDSLQLNSTGLACPGGGLRDTDYGACALYTRDGEKVVATMRGDDIVFKGDPVEAFRALWRIMRMNLLERKGEK